jgi:ribonucleotide monophosphatase NagD (HAD superfamily)
MNMRQAGLFAVVSLLAPVLAGAQAKAPTTAPERTLNVKVNYTGAGTVDAKHKVYVLVFDQDPFTSERLAEVAAKPATSDAQPANGQKTAYVLGRQGASSKTETLSFKNLPSETVYVAVFFDQSGTYDGRRDPGQGSPMSVYGKPGKPDPIVLAAGKPTEVTVSFDDSTKTP